MFLNIQQAGSNRGIASYSGGPRGDGSEMLSGMLSTASPEIQKQMLGERLYPLVYQHEVNLLCLALTMMFLFIVVIVSLSVLVKTVNQTITQFQLPETDQKR